jgi:hypothetical protein
MKTFRIAVLRAVESRLREVLRFETEEFSIGAGEYLKSDDPLPESVHRRLPELYCGLRRGTANRFFPGACGS